MIKLTVSIQEEDPGLSGINTRVLLWARGGKRVRIRERFEGYTLALKVEEGAMSPRTQVASRSWTRPETESSQEPPEGTSLAYTWTIAVTHISEF